jgi:predicted SAM-dependent methyltransferase
MKKNINLFGYNLYIKLKKRAKPTISNNINLAELPKPYKLNFEPGPNWKKPDISWLSVDIDASLGEIVVNFQEFEKLPLENNSVECVYGSHVFEHMSIFKSQLVFNEIYRTLRGNGTFRLILPDAEKSINEYIKGNHGYELFKRRKERAKKNQKIEYTLFESMREYFLSPNGQANLLGKNALAHQNAWAYETIKTHLMRAGFKEEDTLKSEFQKSHCDAFQFEGTYPSEANQDYRSLYVEAIKHS